ncbi:very short patch repair endonuclease [Chryseobacterium limigenitum]|uniref:Very short patch repair endonuclease n=1 Tax=Chryseobacterium limigenitum TaxID=1612149 RepID=A0A1K2ILJ4_9FLAO|nr:very short patch repair endonuclease [Chryseobacterium limigenitum]SFZ93130.1 T/G mismatch-specific endonuclease [Chryseobacterium limigenitum]
MDKHSKEVRSFNMSQVKSKDTKPEILVRKFLFSKGLRYRLYDKKLSGKPDIVLPKYKTVIFIQGCFWHGHENCKYASIPKTRTEFWLNKIEGNIKRDKSSIQKLIDEDWNVLQVFTCELKKDKREQTLNNVLKNIESQFNS